MLQVNFLKKYLIIFSDTFSDTCSKELKGISIFSGLQICVTLSFLKEKELKNLWFFTLKNVKKLQLENAHNLPIAVFEVRELNLRGKTGMLINKYAAIPIYIYTNFLFIWLSYMLMGIFCFSQFKITKFCKKLIVKKNSVIN